VQAAEIRRLTVTDRATKLNDAPNLFLTVTAKPLGFFHHAT
jgi:hypothetical protein